MKIQEITATYKDIDHMDIAQVFSRAIQN